MCSNNVLNIISKTDRVWFPVVRFSSVPLKIHLKSSFQHRRNFLKLDHIIEFSNI